jgi:DNA-binding NtrC family response regulator
LIPGEKLRRAVIIVAMNEPEPGIENDLKARGIAVQWARSIKAASGLLESAHSRTLVITELALRDGDWRDLVERVRATGKFIPVVLLSSTRTAELWWDALECGVEDIFQAPIATSQLRKYLTKHFKMRGDPRS